MCVFVIFAARDVAKYEIEIKIILPNAMWVTTERHNHTAAAKASGLSLLCAQFVHVANVLHRVNKYNKKKSDTKNINLRV